MLKAINTKLLNIKTRYSQIISIKVISTFYFDWYLCFLSKIVKIANKQELCKKIY